jgi:ATP-binding cassette subfamily F protein uup
MPAAPLIALRDIALTFGGTRLIESAELFVSAGERIALVGRNGSGKSTLLRIAAGEIEPDSGERFVEPSATVRYLPQDPDLTAFARVMDYVEAGLTEGDDAYRARYLLEALGLTGQESPKTLSGGEARRAALARVLAPEPDVILLDEPTNHLDLPAIEWLQSELSGLKSALVLISHDRRFLSDLTRSTLWIDRGQTRRLDRGFGAFEAWRDEVLEQEERDRHKLDRQIVREEHWLRYGVTARRKRNVGRLERLAGLRTDRREGRRATGSVSFDVSTARNSGNLVFEAEGVSKSFGERSIVRELTLRIMRGDRLGVVGANGAGKTTVLKLLTGVLEPDSGTMRHGANLVLATLDQGRKGLTPDTTLKDALTGGGSDTLVINGAQKHVHAYMKDFLFTPEQVNTAIGKLSGGERARVALARLLALPSNVLVLDEPTNDLDLETLDLLEEMVADYPGTVVVVSHDRDFLDRVATSVLMSEGDGRWTEYAGGYSDMVSQRGAGVEARQAAVRKAEAKPMAQQAPAADKQKRKLGFKEAHALKTLPDEIAKLDKKIDTLSRELADPALYQRDPNGFASKSKALDAMQADKQAAEDRWLELEMLREELEGR